MSYDLQEQCAENLRAVVKSCMALEALLKSEQKLLFQTDIRKDLSVARRHVDIIAHLCKKVGVSETLIKAIVNGKES